MADIELNISPDEKIAGVPLARLLRNLEETSYDEGSMDLACRLTDCKAVIEELLQHRALASRPAEVDDEGLRSNSPGIEGIAQSSGNPGELPSKHVLENIEQLPNKQVFENIEQLPSKSNIEWGHDLQVRLVALSEDQDGDVRNVMAEAAILLVVLTGPAGAPSHTTNKEK